jgi:NAD-dependent dihydropyrimidine dehydrogenase PreA subunit
MIEIHAERCTGCGACVDACPYGALYLADGEAVVDETLCRDCQGADAVCVSACPNDTIALVEREQRARDVPARVPAQSEPKVIQVKAKRLTTPLRYRVLQGVGVALAWAARNVVPQVADYLLNRPERPNVAVRPTASSSAGVSAGLGGGGKRQQQRNRQRAGQRETT